MLFAYIQIREGKVFPITVNSLMTANDLFTIGEATTGSECSGISFMGDEVGRSDCPITSICPRDYVLLSGT